MYESSYAIIHKTGLHTFSRCCGMKENILSLALSPLCLVYMKFLMPSVIKLGCKRCIYWKRSVEIILFNRSKCLYIFHSNSLQIVSLLKRVCHLILMLYLMVIF